MIESPKTQMRPNTVRVKRKPAIFLNRKRSSPATCWRRAKAARKRIHAANGRTWILVIYASPNVIPVRKKNNNRFGYLRAKVRKKILPQTKRTEVSSLRITRDCKSKPGDAHRNADPRAAYSHLLV